MHPFLPKKSESWAKYPYVARNCALKRLSAFQVAPAPGIWRVEIKTSPKKVAYIWQDIFDRFGKKKGHP